MKILFSNAHGLDMLNILCFFLLAWPVTAEAKGIHFLIPGGVGGGWDTTARAAGRVLKQLDSGYRISYENLSGGGGGRCLSYFIQTADRQQDTLMIQSTQMLISSLKGLYSLDVRSLTPVAALVADYGAFAVRNTSKVTSFLQLVRDYRTEPNSLVIGGGSMRSGMDHIVAASAFSKAGWQAKSVKYVPYDAGGKALTGLFSGEIQVIVSGLGELVELHKAGEVRILAVTSPGPSNLPGVPSLKELKIPMEFVNWRGFFAVPGLRKAAVADVTLDIKKLAESPLWQQTLSRYGWGHSYLAGAAFSKMLFAQEVMLKETMVQLGFLQPELGGGDRHQTRSY